MSGYGNPGQDQAAFQLQPGQDLSHIIAAYMAQQGAQQGAMNGMGGALAKAMQEYLKKKKLADITAQLGGNADAVNQGYDPSQIQGTASLSDSMYT